MKFIKIIDFYIEVDRGNHTKYNDTGLRPISAGPRNRKPKA